MSDSREFFQLLHANDEYVGRVFKDIILPTRFGICELLDFGMRPYQTEFSDILIKETLRARNREIAVIWARQAGGKTSTTAISVLSLILFYLSTIKSHFRVGWFAPAQSVSIQIARQRVIDYANTAAEYMKRFGVHLVKGYGRKRVGRGSPVLIFRNDSNEREATIRSLSANPRSNIKGDTLDLVIIEDSQEVNESKMHTDIFPMASKGAPILMSGVPIPSVEKMNKYYIETITKNPRNAWLSSKDWRECCAFSKDELVKLDAWDEKVQIDPEEVKAYEFGSDSYRYWIDTHRNYILKMRKRLMPRNPTAFLSQFELKWFTSDIQLISMKQLMEFEQEYKSNKERMRFWAIDVAKIEDSTVLTVMERYLGEHQIIGLAEWWGTDYPSQAREAVRFLMQFLPLRYGFIDETGAGGIFIDLFKEELYRYIKENGIKPLEIGSWDGLNFSNRKDVNAMNQLFCMDLRQGKIHYSRKNLDGELLNRWMEQLDNVRRTYHGHYLWLEAPEGFHDDFAISSALCRFASEEKSQKMGAVTINI